jgi:hypothetical protein
VEQDVDVHDGGEMTAGGGWACRPLLGADPLNQDKFPMNIYLIRTRQEEWYC